MILVPVLLERGRRAELRLPVDLSENEARKLANVVTAYVDRDRVFSVPIPSWEAYAHSMRGLQ